MNSLSDKEKEIQQRGNLIIEQIERKRLEGWKSFTFEFTEEGDSLICVSYGYAIDATPKRISADGVYKVILNFS